VAQRLKLTIIELRERLRMYRIRFVGRGKNARIARADVKQLSWPIKAIQVCGARQPAYRT
jgi:hypothetical protein